MKCVICHGTEIDLREVDEQILRGEDFVLVPVEVLVCMNCGERYYDRRTLKQLEEIERDLEAGLVPLETTGAVLRVHPSSYSIQKGKLKMAQIKDMEGIGPTYAGQLTGAGITSVEKLLEEGKSPQGRKAIAEKTGISGKLILEWVNHADLFRIKGVGEEYSDLLEASGVDTVVELAQRNPINLYAKLVSVNAEKNLVRQLPSQGQVEKWVAQAKALPRIIAY